MATAPSREFSPDIITQFSSVTVEEQELKARKEIKGIELEERVANLEAKRDAMKWRQEERLRQGYDGDGERERTNLHVHGAVGTIGATALSGEGGAEAGHSDRLYIHIYNMYRKYGYKTAKVYIYVVC